MVVMVYERLVFSRYPNMIIEPLKIIHQYQLKGVRVTEYYSESDVEYDTKRECWAISEKSCIKTVCKKIEELFDIKLEPLSSQVPEGKTISPQNNTTR